MSLDCYTEPEELPVERPADNDGGYVYVIGFSSGTVKVGSTIKPRGRIRSHRATAACFGVDLVDCWVSRYFADYLAGERRLVEAAGRIADRVHAREWFTGVTFADVVAVAPELTFSNRGGQVLRQTYERARRLGINPGAFYNIAEMARVLGVREAAAREVCPSDSPNGMSGFKLLAYVESRRPVRRAA